MQAILEGILKVFLRPPPPLERESLLGLLNQQYIEYIFCQYKNEVVKIIFFLRQWKAGPVDSYPNQPLIDQMP